jgi:hypothetical protein
MRRTIATLALVLALVPAAGAEARAVLGMGDQKPTLFSDPRFRWLGVRHARIVVSWDVMASKSERAWARAWLLAARRDGVAPLVAFGHGWTGPSRKALPSAAAYRAAVARFRRAYPWITTYSAWNEANHCSQPTCHHPERAAAYFDAVSELCPKCTVVAADVLDQRNMDAWLRRFSRAAQHTPRVWGLHNYLDANRLRGSGTDRLLGLVRGRVWITETGGVVHRNHYQGQISFPESNAHAALVTRYVLGLTGRRPRIERVYLYQWNADSLFQAWDSGLIDPFNQRRPAYAVVARFLGRDPNRAPADPAFISPTPAPPGPAGPGAEQQPPPSSPPPSGGSPPPPSEPPPTCVVPPLCLPGGLGSVPGSAAGRGVR